MPIPTSKDYKCEIHGKFEPDNEYGKCPAFEKAEAKEEK